MKLNPQIKLLILEDNIMFSDLLKILLNECGINNIYVAHSYEQGIELFNRYLPDICLLDIDLGNTAIKTGISFAEKIRETAPNLPIIYLTSDYSDHCYEQSRHTRPSSFMSKEISRFKLEHAIDIALLQTENQIIAPTEPPPNILPSSFFFKIGDTYKAIPIQDITYFFSDKKLNYARVAQRNFPTSVQLKTLESEFSRYFFRIHKSYLVNINFIETIKPGEGIVIAGGETLPLGYAYRKSFLGRLILFR